MGLSLMAGLADGSLIKGMGIGLDAQIGVPRFTGGNHELFARLSQAPVPLGLRALSEGRLMIEEGATTKVRGATFGGLNAIPFGALKGFRSVILRRSTLGHVIGMIPGAGASIASDTAPKRLLKRQNCSVKARSKTRVVQGRDHFGGGGREGGAPVHPPHLAPDAGAADHSATGLPACYWIGRDEKVLLGIPTDLCACASGACAQEYPSAVSRLTVSGSTLSLPAATPRRNMSGARKSRCRAPPASARMPSWRRRESRSPRFGAGRCGSWRKAVRACFTTRPGRPAGRRYPTTGRPPS
ncbi:MAG: hypothetical protein ACJAVS_002856 [Paracoccaceae bacterium]|jgi:hypothetical protein